ncbi:hypothetical protein BV22DRAFT_1051246 [Leucogyrophana mollusca]|uniref:Uncharacterized protein n=1 Tax=Leucogyrophana mollusca TaxID=85980 RepID=A0ACB8B233_9AGAM|nr:hypothetical protein BV22DRAFT_1051246 [Leucogyrophana mollusca]
MPFMLGDIWVIFDAQTVSWYNGDTWQPGIGNCAKQSTMHPIMQGYKLYYIPKSPFAVKWFSAQSVSSVAQQETVTGASASVGDVSNQSCRDTKNLKRKQGDECDEGLLLLTNFMQGNNFTFDVHHQNENAHLDVGTVSHVLVPTDLLLSAFPT